MGDEGVRRRRRGQELEDALLDAAWDELLEQGYDAFTIEALAANVHCSPATVYRHAGGKAAIRDAVIGIHAGRIMGAVRDAIDGLNGPERVVTATAVALQRNREALQG